MLSRIRPHLTYANVMSSLCLFVLLGGSAYAATKISGKNLKKRSVAGVKLKKNTVTGTEVREAKLGKVPSAAHADTAASADTAGDAKSVGGVERDFLTRGRSVNVACNPTDATYVACGSISYTTTRPSFRLVTNASVGWRNAGAAPPTTGNCRLAVDGVAQTETNVRFGQDQAVFETSDERAYATINFATGSLPTGTHKVEVQCNETADDVVIGDGSMSVVVVGSG
jgi:hypothetical protein